MRRENIAAKSLHNCWDDLAVLTSTTSFTRSGPTDSDPSSASFDRLVRVVESEIVPRLMVARQAPPEPTPIAHPEEDGPPGAVELVRLLLAHDASIAVAHVAAISQQGKSMQEICLQLLAPAARILGDRWERDESDFMQVTLALCKLHQVLHQISAVLRPSEDTENMQPARRVLLAAVPGEQHTFGVVMVGQFFRADGWDVWNEFPGTDDVLMEIVHRCWFAVVGLSVGSDVRLSCVTSAVEAIRRASCNRSVRVMLGGPVLLRRPELATVLGGDATASDGREAVLTADSMFMSMPQPAD